MNRRSPRSSRKLNVFDPFLNLMKLYGVNYRSSEPNIKHHLLSLLPFILSLLLTSFRIFSFGQQATEDIAYGNHFFYNILALVALVHLFKTRTKVLKIFTYINLFISDDLKPSLVRISWYFMVLWFCYVVWDVPLQVIFSYRHGIDQFLTSTVYVNADGMSSLTKFAMVTLFSISSSISAGFMLQICTPLYLFILRVFKDIISDFLKQEFATTDVEIENYIRRWSQLKTATSTFEDLFSIYPLLWFSNLFVKSCVFLVKLKSMSFEINAIILVSYGWFASECVLSSLVLFTIDRVNKSTRMMYDNFKRQNMSRLLVNPKFDRLSVEINDSLSLNLTAWSLFDLNKKFMLSFISSLVSFSVLFMQLSN